MLLLLSASCERLSLARSWSTTPLPLLPTFASFWCQWAPSLRRHSTIGRPKSAPWRIFASAIFHLALKTKKVYTPSLCAFPALNGRRTARFMPSPKSKGYLHLCFPTHPPSSSHFGMSLFRPSYFPLGVIGIASWSQTDSLSTIIAEFSAAVRDLFPPDSMYPLAKSCFVFEEGDGTTNLNLGDHLAGLVIIPSMMGNKKENIETLLADLCSNILAEFTTVVCALSRICSRSEEEHCSGQHPRKLAWQRASKCVPFSVLSLCYRLPNSVGG